MSAPTAASAPATVPWWLVYPERLAAEHSALAAAGATWAEDTLEGPDQPADPPADPAVAPLRLTLRVDWPHPDRRPGDPETLTLRVTYPAAYPWFAPTVTMPEPLTRLRRHRNPITGVLCLLADSGDWRPDTTLGHLLTEQLPRLLAAGRGTGADPGAATLALEAGPEAAWTRMRLSVGGLLVDAGCLPPRELPCGWADLVRVGRAVGPVSAVVTLRDAEHRLLWESDMFSRREVARVRWVRLTDLPDEIGEPEQLWDHAVAQREELVWDVASDAPNTLLVLVPSEGAGRRPCEEWLLLSRRLPGPEILDMDDAEHSELAGPHRGTRRARHETAGTQLALFPGPSQAAEARPAPAESRMQVRVRRGYPIGRDDLTARLPDDTTYLAYDSVTVVGVGALGGPVALELARAGVGRLHLVDGDTHDPATGARQLPSFRDAGSPKALAVAMRILESNPHVQLTCGMRDLGADDGRELLGLAASSVVIDCTGNAAATRYLAAHLRATGTPLLIAAATAGGWGGTITTLPAAGDGCWECLQLHRADRTVPWPPARPDGQLTPAGCSHPSYIGGWFDLGTVALQAIRTALALLTTSSADVAAGGSPFGDVQVLTQYQRGRPIHPRWRTSPLTVHPACPLHPQIADGGQVAPLPARAR